MCGKFEIKQAEKKNGWAEQEASQNLSPKQWQQKRGKKKKVALKWPSLSMTGGLRL